MSLTKELRPIAVRNALGAIMTLPWEVTEMETMMHAWERYNRRPAWTNISNFSASASTIFTSAFCLVAVTEQICVVQNML